jgi:sec-independent protein translocase protein TatA
VFGRIGPTELIIILVIVVLIFGVGKLADVGGALGRGIKEFRHTVKDDDEEEPAVMTTSDKAAEEPKPAERAESYTNETRTQH